MIVNGYEIKRKANLEGTNLYRADLQEANLKRINLEGANLRCADLFKAKLEEANFEGADFRGAYLTGVNITQEQLESTFSYEGAKIDVLKLLQGEG